MLAVYSLEGRRFVSALIFWDTPARVSPWQRRHLVR